MRSVAYFFLASLFAVSCGGTATTPAGSAADASPSPGGDAGAPDDHPATCDAPLPKDVQIPAVDLEGYPPYAGDGCSLVYVAAASGELRFRDLKTGADTTLASATESPRRPSIAGRVIAWEAKDGARAVVRVHVGDATTTISGSFDHAGEPRATSDAVVFTGWLGADDRSDTDVFLFDPVAARAEVVLGGPAQQRFADVSRGAVAAADFSEDPDGTFDNNATDLADIILFDRGTRGVTRRPRPGKQAFPMLASPTKIGYLDWGEVHPEPKLAAYALRVGDVAGQVSGDVTVAMVESTSTQYVLPAGRNGVFEWIDRPAGTPSLWRVPADLSRSPAAVSGLEGLDLFAPASAASFTLLGTRPLTGSAVVLRGVAR